MKNGISLIAYIMLLIALIIVIVVVVIIIINGKDKNEISSNDDIYKALGNNTQVSEYYDFIEEDEANKCNVYISKEGQLLKLSTEKYILPERDIYNNCILAEDRQTHAKVVIDINFNILLDESYKITDSEHDTFTIYKNGKYTVIDKFGKEIVKTTENYVRGIEFEKENLVYFKEETGEKDDKELYTIYTNVAGKILSNVHDASGFTYYPKDNVKTGILRYNDSFSYDGHRYYSVYVNSITGEELDRTSATRSIEIHKNCCMEIKDSNNSGSRINKSIKFFDNNMNFVREVNVNQSYLILDDYVEIDNVLYTHEGKKLTKFNYEKDETIGFINNLIIITKNKNATVYTPEGEKILEIMNYNNRLEKDNKLYINYKGTSLASLEKVENDKITWFEKINDSDRYYKISYESKKMKIFDAEKSETIWTMDKQPDNIKFIDGILAVQIDNTYYNYYGQKIYEKIGK